MFACVRKCGVEAGGGVHPVRPAQVVGRRRRRWSRRRRRGVGGDGGRGSVAYVCPLPALSRRTAHCNKKKRKEKKLARRSAGFAAGGFLPPRSRRP